MARLRLTSASPVTPAVGHLHFTHTLIAQLVDVERDASGLTKLRSSELCRRSCKCEGGAWPPHHARAVPAELLHTRSRACPRAGGDARAAVEGRLPHHPHPQGVDRLPRGRLCLPARVQPGCRFRLSSSQPSSPN